MDDVRGLKVHEGDTVLVGVPDGWTIAQVEAYHEYFKTLHPGINLVMVPGPVLGASAEHDVLSRIRIETSGRAGSKFQFGIRVSCANCGALFPVTHAEIVLDKEDWPMATLTVIAPEVGGIEACVRRLVDAPQEPSADVG